jgi:hypothetical protein
MRLTFHEYESILEVFDDRWIASSCSFRHVHDGLASGSVKYGTARTPRHDYDVTHPDR